MFVYKRQGTQWFHKKKNNNNKKNKFKKAQDFCFAEILTGAFAPTLG